MLTGLLTAPRLSAGDVAQDQALPGRLIITNFASAPFPHPLRAEGHTYKDKFFSAAEHYQDSSVALFIPKGFHVHRKIDFVVHFHGWGNNVTNALRQYLLPEQFAAASRNAILIVPQGPLNASDSFGGKLEDADGFKRFIAEALETLRRNGIVDRAELGRIILSGHSGGYEVISAILDHGGLADNVREVWLFDALYGKTDLFTHWFDNHPGRFIDLYTEHGGTKDESEALLSALAKRGAPYFSADETNATAGDLRNHHLVFLFSELPHDEVLQHRDTFRRFLETSSLEPIGPKSVRDIEVRDAPEALALVERAREIGNDVYPQILDLLGDGKSDAPRRLDIVFRTHVVVPQFAVGEEALGCAYRKTVVLNAGFLCEHPENLDALLVHEMAHVAQNYSNFPYRHAWQWYAHRFSFTAMHPFGTRPPNMPFYWTEGIADYVCAKLGHTNAWSCPQCDEHYSHYTGGYTCAAAFLLYIDNAYGTRVIRRLNSILRDGTYSDQFFAEVTGRTLDELWADFEETGAYTPIAAQINELRQALGYENGKPPKDLELRLEKYFSKHPELKGYFATLGTWHGRAPEDAQRLIEFIIYTLQQPGGQNSLQTADAAFMELHQALGYTDGKPPGDLRKRLLAYLDTHPDIKEFVAANRWLQFVPLPEIQGLIEGMIIGGLHPGWKTTVSAEEFLTSLKHQNKLPGLRESQHSTLTIQSQGKELETYPIDRIFESRTEGKSEIYTYVVVKDAADSDWKLKRAWETTTKGRLVKDFVLP